MKLKEKLDIQNKETLFDFYSRIVLEFKDYNKITKEKMKTAILKEYKDYNNIIEICTNKELKYLKLLLENNNKLSYDSKYEWEIKTLEEKLLITTEIDKLIIPEDIYETVSKAVQKVKWQSHKKTDKLNELMIGVCKAYGELPISVLLNIIVKITNIEEQPLIEHVFNNRLFSYYIHIYNKYIPSMTQKTPFFIYKNYFHLINKLDKSRNQKTFIKIKEFHAEDYISIFYNNLNLNNKKINKIYNEIKKLKHSEFLIDIIVINVLLNEDRTNIYNFIKEMYSNEIKDMPKFIKLLEEAMSEMPSATLNGFDTKELK